ncbi:flagellar protein FlaG [Miltoncostaea marina]|uniref:flagellar protein FlaG n=1 Tax=Miltoncostaea marina TaxID=2843215 RepID=UPI001C3D2EC5|nr:flagellar protein FlaG [Miltoncostaea marina]
MDVTAPPAVPEPTAEPAPRRSERAAPAEGADAPPARPMATGGEGRWEPRSTLKFVLTAADVDARFEIDEATNTVTVTMYDRQTGEVLREIPSRRVRDAVAAIAPSGLRVDAAS